MTRRLSLPALVLAALLAAPSFACAQYGAQYVYLPVIASSPAYLNNQSVYEFPGASAIVRPAHQAMVVPTLNAQPGAYLSIQPSGLTCGFGGCFPCYGNECLHWLPTGSSQIPAPIGQLIPQPQVLGWNTPSQAAIVPTQGIPIWTNAAQPGAAFSVGPSAYPYGGGQFVGGYPLGIVGSNVSSQVAPIPAVTGGYVQPRVVPPLYRGFANGVQVQTPPSYIIDPSNIWAMCTPGSKECQ